MLSVTQLKIDPVSTAPEAKVLTTVLSGPLNALEFPIPVQMITKFLLYLRRLVIFILLLVLMLCHH